MGRISTTMVASVVREIEGLDSDGWVRMVEGLSSSQPTPTGFVVALSRMGLPMPELDHVIHVLLVIAECFRRISSKPLPKVTDEMLEASAKKINAMARLIEGASSESDRTMGLIVDEHPERELFVYVLDSLAEHGMIVSKPLYKEAVFGAVVVLEVFMQAAAQAQDPPE